MAGSPKPSTVRSMTDPEIAWLAGILEGEGSFLLLRRRGKPLTPRISMGSSDADVLERIAEITGVGSVAPIAELANVDRLGSKPMWQWRLTRREDIRVLCAALRPWLGERRRGQVDAILDHMSAIPVARAGYCARQLHRMTPENTASNGGSGTCRACMNARRREQAATRRAKLCAPA